MSGPHFEGRPGSSKGRPGAGAGDAGTPSLRGKHPGRPADARGRSHAVLDQVQRASEPEVDVPALVRQAQAGDEVAFAELYVLFIERVHRYLLVALKNVEDAQEVAQEAFTRAFSRLEIYDPGRGEFRDWLFRLVRNATIDHLRKGTRATETALRIPPSQAVPLADHAASLLERLDPDSGVRSLIDDLPEPQKRVLALRFVFGFETPEICDVVGSSPDAVRHVQHRALKALAAGMAQAPELGSDP